MMSGSDLLGIITQWRKGAKISNPAAVAKRRPSSWSRTRSLSFASLRLCVRVWSVLACAGVVAAAEPRTSVLVVVGAEGEADYGRQFQEWAGRWKEAAQSGDADFAQIGCDEPGDSSDRRRLENWLTTDATASTGPLWLILIGHGTFDGKTARFNLRGPDMSAAELAGWLKPLARTLAIVNCASSSGPFLNELSGPDRVVITATKSGNEVNFARFGDYLSSAITDPRADLDKDEQVSLLEAFLMAASGVREFYAREGRLETEHPLIDDNGDRLGTRADWFRGVRAVKMAQNGARPDGVRANQMYLVRGRQEQQLSASARERRDRLELELAGLRERKADMSEDDYFKLLEPILVELARLYGE
jgi:hypothetical protein